MLFSFSLSYYFDSLRRVNAPSVVLTLLLSTGTISLGWQRSTESSQLEAAQQKLSQGKFREVVEDLKFVITKKPSDPKLLMTIGVAEDHLGLYTDGNNHMKVAISRLPLCATCWVNLGVSYSHLEQPSDAEHAFLQAIRIDPKMANAYFNLGQIYFDQGKAVEATKVLEKARELAPTDFGIRAELAQSYFKSSNEAGLQLALNEIEASCGVDLSCHIRVAALFARVGRADVAKQKFESLRHSVSDASDISYHEALLYYQLGDLDQAEKLLETIPGTVRNQPKIQELMGSIAARRGYYGNAIARFSNAAKAEPSERNLFNLAYTLYIDAQFEKAKQILVGIVRDFPSSFRACLTLGAVNQELGKYSESIEAYRRVLALSPNSAVAYVFLGDVEMLASNYPSALKSFRKAVSVAPGLAEAHFYLGLALLQSGRTDDLHESVSHFKQAVESNPSFLEAYVQLGKSLLRQGEVQPALAALQQALAIGPESPQVHYVLAQCYRRAGQAEKVEYHLKKFEELKGKDEHKALQQTILTSAVAEHPRDE